MKALLPSLTEHDVSYEDADGLTAVGVAKRNGYPAVVTVLERYLKEAARQRPVFAPGDSESDNDDGTLWTGSGAAEAEGDSDDGSLATVLVETVLEDSKQDDALVLMLHEARRKNNERRGRNRHY